MVRSSSGWKASLRERRFEKVVATFLPFPVLIFFVHAAAEVAGGHVYALKRGPNNAVTRWREKIRERSVFAGFANVCSGQCRKMWAKKTTVQPPFEALERRIYQPAPNTSRTAD